MWAILPRTWNFDILSVFLEFAALCFAALAVLAVAGFFIALVRVLAHEHSED